MSILLRRLPVLIVLGIVLAFLVSCARQPATTGTGEVVPAVAPTETTTSAAVAPSPRAGEVAPEGVPAACANQGHGDPDPAKPVVCVSTNPLAVNPEPVIAYRSQNGKDVRIRWIARGGTGHLSVQLKDGDCFTPEGSPNTYYFDAKVSRANAGRGRQECHYAVTLDGQTLDPTVVVDDNPTP